MFNTQYFAISSGLSGVSTGLFEATLLDDDLVRGNSADERVEGSSGLAIFNGYTAFVQTGNTLSSVERVFREGEVSTTVTFNDGTVLTDVLGLTDFSTFNYGGSVSRFLLDQGSLEAIGKSLSDIADIEIDAFVDHDLSFADLGFGEAEQPAAETEAEQPAAETNVIDGTDGDDRLVGTNGDDVFVSSGGRDRLRGGEGADTFVFGRNSDDAVRDRSVITDFDADEDFIVLEAGTEIRNVTELLNGNLRITLEGDRDKIIIRDADESVLENIIFTEDLFLL